MGSYDKTYSNIEYPFSTGNPYIDGKIILSDIKRTRSANGDTDDSTDTLTMTGNIYFRRNNNWTGAVTWTPKAYFSIYINGVLKTSGNSQDLGWEVPNGGTWYLMNYGNFWISIPNIEPLSDYKFTIGFQSSCDNNVTAFTNSLRTSGTYTIGATAKQVGISTINNMYAEGNTCKIDVTIGPNGDGGNPSNQCHIYYTTDGTAPSTGNYTGVRAITGGAGARDTASVTVDRSCKIRAIPYTTSKKANKWAWPPLQHPNGIEKSLEMTFNNTPTWPTSPSSGHSSIARLWCTKSRNTPNAIFAANWDAALPYNTNNPVGGYLFTVYAKRNGTTIRLHSSTRPTNETILMSSSTLDDVLKTEDVLYFTIQPYATVVEPLGPRKCWGTTIYSNELIIGDDGWLSITDETGTIRSGRPLVKLSDGWHYAKELYVRVPREEILVKSMPRRGTAPTYDMKLVLEDIVVPQMTSEGFENRYIPVTLKVKRNDPYTYIKESNVKWRNCKLYCSIDNTGVVWKSTTLNSKSSTPDSDGWMTLGSLSLPVNVLLNNKVFFDVSGYVNYSISNYYFKSSYYFSLYTSTYSLIPWVESV